MTDVQQRNAAKEFTDFRKDKGYEKGQSQPFWTSLLRDVYGIEHPEEYISFEDQVKIDSTSFIDGYIDSTHVLIEQKSLGKNLNAPIVQSDKSRLTPFQQAKRYSAELPYDKRPRWIITCNFGEFYIYDMNTPSGEPQKLLLSDLPQEYYRLNFLVDTGDKNIKKEMEVSIQAGDLVGCIYDAFAKQYKNIENMESQKSLNKLCVRLVFCLYAEDAGVFGEHGKFHRYMEPYPTKDCRRALIDLFKVLDTKIEDRDPYMDETLASFPYVNGGLFSDEDIEIPQFTDEIKTILLAKASEDFDWSDISPTIFGAVFESTLNPETRRSGGMHYTSIENIHKVINPLFLDDLKEELSEIKTISVDKTRIARLKDYQKKIASLTFLDPAAGSGNFLTQTYLDLRILENEVIRLIADLAKGAISGQISFADEHTNPIQVSIGQFYGIEINDFAVTVAQTALWIAENQMMKKTEEILHMNLDFLPLKSYTNIHEGNALRMKWEDVVGKNQLNYIMGNPPFSGSSIKSKADEQKKDKEIIFGNSKAGKLDYVSCWYQKAADYIIDTQIKAAYVSTNSITQGEQVRPLWENLLKRGIFINFAYRTFNWKSEASDTAHVHCVIIGFWMQNEQHKFLYIDGIKKEAAHINGYLVDAPDFYIISRGKALEGFPKLTQGNKPWDDGGLILSYTEREALIKKYPQIEKYIKPYVGSKDFLNSIERYCLWLVDAEPCEYSNIPEIKERLRVVSALRADSPTLAVRQQANTPYLFSQIRQPDSDYILIPETSASTRRYIPMGFMNKDVIASNSVMTAANADLYLLGMLESNVHMSWVQTLCGRMKSDYRYSPALYNNFPWPTPTDVQKQKIEQTAQEILDARAKYPNSTLADLYDPLIMPSELITAHQHNDKAVMQAYGFKLSMTKPECVAELMKMYQKLTKESK